MAVSSTDWLDALGLSMLGNIANISMVTPANRKTPYDKSDANEQKDFEYSLPPLIQAALSVDHANHLTMRWSERRTAVRSTFDMISTLPLRPTRGFVRRRSSCSR